MYDIFNEIIKEGEKKLEDKVDEACFKMSKRVEDWKRFDNESKLDTGLKDIKDRLLNRTLKEEIEIIAKKLNQKYLIQLLIFLLKYKIY